MNIKHSRLVPRLAPFGFVLGWVDDIVREIVFVRAGEHSQLFERLRVQGAGRRGEAIVASVAVSVVWGRNATKGLIKSEVLLELAVDRSRGWTIIQSAKQARAWEERLIEVAPHRLEEFTRKEGPTLATETAVARDAVTRYADALRRVSEKEALSVWAGKVTRAQRAEARRLAQWPGVLQLPGAEAVYELAALSILSFADRVEEDGTTFTGEDPITNKELMWRLQILVDVLSRHPDWTTVSEA